MQRDQYTLNPALAGRVVAAVGDYERRRERRLIFLWAGAAALGAAIAVLAADNVVHAFATSGFGQYVSVLFSDMDMARLYWKELLLALLDALPLPSVIFALGAALACIGSLRALVNVAVGHPQAARA